MRISRGVPLLLVAALLLGCGDDDDAASSATLVAERDETTTTAKRITTTANPDAELKAEIEQAYHAQWDAFLEIFSDPDPTNPLIDQHFTGEQKEQILDSISQFVRDGTALRPPDDPERFRATVLAVDLETDTATVDSCLVDGLEVVRRGSGEVVNGEVATLRLRMDFVRVEGAWKLSRTERTERHEGTASCGS